MFPVFSQNGNLSFECSTPSSSRHSPIMESLRVTNFSYYDFYLKVYVHVLSHTEYGSGQTKLGINESMRRLYDTFDDEGIYLVWDGDVDYIVNDDYYNLTGDYQESIYNTNYHEDGIDIYLGNSLSPIPFARAKGIADYTEFIVSGNNFNYADNDYDFWTHNSTIVHEMGHVLFLWHTFHGTNSIDDGDDINACPECIDDYQKGWYCGDYVYDTNPDIGDGIDQNCNYTFGGQDVCGNPLTPLTNNFMSYAPDDCRTEFTSGQKLRMKNAIAILPNLQNTQLQEYTYLRGPSIICYNGFYDIFSDDLSSVTIESPENLDVVITEITNTVIKFKATIVGEPIPDEGYASYVIIKKSGVEVARKDIWVGKPQKMLDNSISGDAYVVPGDERTYSLPTLLGGTYTKKGFTSYEWNLPGWEKIITENFNPPYDNWKHDILTNNNFEAETQVGECSGELYVYGINECGGYFGEDDVDGLVIYVNYTASDCPGENLGIIYYPNPANDLLSVDLTLQDYKVFTILIYDEAQTVKYSGQSTNVVKSVEVFNLINGTYYLHIYDGSDLILSKILIINR